MNSVGNVAKILAFLISLQAIVSRVLGCGVMPPASTTTGSVPARIPGIATSMGGAQAFVSRIVMQAVTDVLEQQRRGAGLSDPIIAIILVDGGMMPHCIIVGSTVTSLCTPMGGGNMCDISMNMGIATIPAGPLSISRSLTTTNIIMANWSREMWQGVVNRAVRMLASGPFGANFFSAFATVN